VHIYGVHKRLWPTLGVRAPSLCTPVQHMCKLHLVCMFLIYH